ncbi:Oidioi.mRNA.OKI2018_I69.chr2.g4078.t1.cds [Oikopleura dioica]|uniref:Oidioi.mRNA.OKI2018_I69.chr2.g4078.t1.cds n=1 Tax=Oikopleura dioica TaxID=34765 RepID=A0ABN7T2M9_OIKDI|nr:Oidioi.mRNA.OKI2018_I69.chr2.g4078.t1.cds [Oikopleura dioica]
MAFKFALAAVVAGSRTARDAQQDLVNCRDTKPWLSCITAYTRGECFANIGCDRTCGQCSSSACYDRIPVPHVKLYEDNAPVRAMWPTIGNQNGQNSFPALKELESREGFPFEESSISKFCLDVFNNGLCDSWDQLTLHYEDASILLTGMPNEYCQFTCGYCNDQTSDDVHNSCVNAHNNIMTLLAGENKIQNVFDYGLGEETTTEGPASTESPAIDEAEEEEDEGEEEECDWFCQFFSGGDAEHSNTWWRRRRSAIPLEKREVIVSAIESILKNSNVRNRREAEEVLFSEFGWFTNEFNAPEAVTTNHADGLENCNDKLFAQNDGDLIEEEEIEEFEENEELMNPFSQIAERRWPQDSEAIQRYFNKNSNVNLGECQWVEIPASAAEELEDLASTELTYDCSISCPEGTALFISDKEASDEEIRMNCSKDSRFATNMQRDSSCQAANYCPNNICERLECREVEEEEGEEVETFEWDF